MGQKRRMRRLQRKARIARHDAAHPGQTNRSKQKAHSNRASIHLGTDMGVVPFGVKEKEELLRTDPSCRESIFLPNGVAIKVYDRRVWVVAPESAQRDPAFFEMLDDVMIHHFCGHDRFEQVLREQGLDAATKLLEDVITDVDYYDDSQ